MLIVNLFVDLIAIMICFVFIKGLFTYRKSLKTTYDQLLLLGNFKWAILYQVLYNLGKFIVLIFWGYPIDDNAQYILGLFFGIPIVLWWRKSFKKYAE